ncbi:ABC transporter A family member 1 isoform X2 [Nymphaea colorata]|nr:ABC transporter A family member 1 isoform X2 [Nymphaea colorata]
MLNLLSLRFPLLKIVGQIYKDELEIESYIRSNHYGQRDQIMNFSKPKIKGAVIFHECGPQIFDYSIRLNHSWAFSGFPDVNTIMDTNGPYVNDLELGVSAVPTMQYGLSGFLTLQQVMDSLIIFSSQINLTDVVGNMKFVDDGGSSELYASEVTAEDKKQQLVGNFVDQLHFKYPWTKFIPSTIRIVPFPTREYTDDEFQSIVKRVMGVLYLLGFLYPVSRLISYSVSEKEQRVREGLQMMGLRDNIFYLSWFITYTAQFAVSAAIITCCTMTTLFHYSDKTVVFTYFFLFGLSAIMLSFLISTFFSRAKTAVAVGTLTFLGVFFPYYTVNDPATSMMWKAIASLLSPTAFALGTVNFADYERAHVGVRWSNIWRDSSGVNFLICLCMLIFDSVLYCVIALYLDKVLPREYGVQKPWNFLFTKSFWKKKSCNPDLYNETFKDEWEHKSASHVESLDGYQPIVEPISLEMRKQEADGRCVQIRHLSKVFKTKKGKCCAVNSLQLTLYENQVLALLGHNGAGKSTTISMLVGLLAPTSGDAVVFGKNIKTDMDQIRKELGVCPQNDVLFPELTVKEHLRMFAILKGVTEDRLENEVNLMIEEVCLLDKQNTAVRALSGGMRRKLSLGIALIGGSKLVILDEPTTGMDPYSMRSTWQLIKRIKKGRVILLTTHSMDEADVLGDRIAIMSNGYLRCCGSSLFLKHCYGVGYTLTLVKSNPDARTASDIVGRHVPSAICLSDVGSEISFRLPLSSSSSFEGMFMEIESNTKRRGALLEKSGCSEESCIGIESYGISVTTLEEVFLRVAGCDLDEIKPVILDKADHSDEWIPPHASSSCLTSNEPNGNLLLCAYWVPLGKTFSALGFIVNLIITTLFGFLNIFKLQCCGCGDLFRFRFCQHLRALLIKRATIARRDRKTIIFQLLIPALFLFLGLLFLKLKPHPDQESITLTTSHFNPLLQGGGGGGPIPFNLSTQISNQVASFMEGGWSQKAELRSYRFPNTGRALFDSIEVAGPILGPSLLSMSEYLITSLNESYQSRYGAVLMDDQNGDGSIAYTVLHNCSCQHGAPTYINLVNSAILKLAMNDGNMVIHTRNHPLPMTATQHSQHHDLDAFSAAIIINIAFSFIPSSFAVAIVKEREVKAKHQQLISGVSVVSYWISIYIWDFISFLFPTFLAMLLFAIFGLDQFIGVGCFWPTIFLFLEYGLAVAASTYCLTFFFTDHSVAQNIVLLVHFFSGLILMVISFIMGLIKATKSVNIFLKKIFRLAPGFCFADGLASLALRRQGIKLSSGKAVLDWNVTGASLCYLGMESIIYFALVLGIELLPWHKLEFCKETSWWRQIIEGSIRDIPEGTLEPLMRLRSSLECHKCGFDEDVDVQAERHRVLSGAAKNSIIRLSNLCKVYSGGRQDFAKIAVDNLCFAVQEGECFGFLGTNGAGKTTTLRMLSGEECPTDGTAYIFGIDIRINPKAACQNVGYCPQFDALLELLTVQEHLELYARIKGVPGNRIDDVVEEKLTEFDLWKQANKPSCYLSGGNKRKLSVAIAMIGDPPIVILDEPSAGMDPIAKRFMWNVISHLSTRQGKTAVLLTTHSMSEAQALCTRIGIMVGGRLQCIGSPQHLKTRFGNHLELEVRPTDVTRCELDNLCSKIQGLLSDFPCHPKGVLHDLEICIGGNDLILPADVSEICLSEEMVAFVGRFLENESRVRTLLSGRLAADGVFSQQLSEQLARDGGIPLRIFSEWWLAEEKYSLIDSFILSTFHGAIFQGLSGLNIKYQLPYGEDSSLAEIFGHLERNRSKLGISEYSISQSTLETIFNHFAGNS